MFSDMRDDVQAMYRLIEKSIYLLDDMQNGEIVSRDRLRELHDELQQCKQKVDNIKEHLFPHKVPRPGFAEIMSARSSLVEWD